MNERIQKVLANAGVGSRRQIEQWIREGRIRVNQNVAILGTKISAHDKIFLDNRAVNLVKVQNKKVRVLLYYKPEGEICTRRDPEGRPTIFDHLPLLRNSRWISVGRLDFNTSGLLILTNDGELANHLMHPSHEFEREYAVRIRGQVSPDMIKTLKKGVELEDGVANFLSVVDIGGERSNHWYHVIVKQGRNRVVRRLWESLGVTVSRLMRVRFGNITLPKTLKRGRWVEMEKDEVNLLLETKSKNE